MTFLTQGKKRRGGQSRNDIGIETMSNISIYCLHSVEAVSYTHLDVYKRQPSFQDTSVIKIKYFTLVKT